MDNQAHRPNKARYTSQVPEVISLFSETGQPSVALFAQVAFLTPKNMGSGQARGKGCHETTGHPHPMVEGGWTSQDLFLPSFLQYHENQRALVALFCLSSRNSFSALISINAENTRSHYAKI